MADPARQIIDFPRPDREGHLVNGQPAEFPEALRRLPRGVSVVTFGEAGKQFGLTATSVALLSKDPPSILVGVNRASPVSQEFLGSRAFGVSVLAGDHNALADHFLEGARIADRERRAEGVWVAPASGVPLLAEAVVAFDCELNDIMECHDHAIVVGRVRGVRTSSKSSALIYWRGAYYQLGWTEDEISRAVGLKPVRPSAPPQGQEP